MSLMSHSDLVTPMAIRVAATLRLADLIAEGICTSDELAARCGADPDALHRLLRYLACRGLFTETGPGRFGLTDTVAPLCSDHPLAMRDWFDLDAAGGRMDRAFTALLEVVRTGEPGYPVVHGRSLWDDTDASYNTLMAGHTRFAAPAVVGGYPWSRVRSLVDVGGGSGALLSAIASAAPDLTATLLDLPDAADAARKTFADAGLADRCTAVAGDFFGELPGGAEVYLLTWVLHDWPDADAERILGRCAEAAGEHGRVVVVENLDTGERPEITTAMDMRLLVLFGGRERSAAQLDALAAAAGLRRFDSRILPGPTPVSLVEYAR